MNENMSEDINYFEKKFKFKSTFVKNESLLSNEFQINFLDNKNKILDKYAEISIELKDKEDSNDKKKNKINKVRKKFKKKKENKKS